MAAAACGKSGTACNITTVWQELGHIPSVEKLVEMVKEFAIVHQSLSHEEKVMLARAWSAQLWRRRQAAHKTNWWHAKDSVGAVMAIACQAGWTPAQPVRWSAPDAPNLCLDPGQQVMFADVLTKLREALLRTKWPREGCAMCQPGCRSEADDQATPWGQDVQPP